MKKMRYSTAGTPIFFPSWLVHPCKNFVHLCGEPFTSYRNTKVIWSLFLKGIESSNHNSKISQQ